MMLQMKKGNLLRKGIAAFLMLVMACSGVAFAAEDGDSAENNQPAVAIAQQEPGDEDEANDVDESSITESDSEDEDDLDGDGGIIIFAPDEEDYSNVEDGIDDEEWDEEDAPEQNKKPSNIKGKLNYTKTIPYEGYQTHNFTVSYDGKKVMAYCIQPSRNWGGAKKYTAKPYYKKAMVKALYYCYGNPGYKLKTKSYLSQLSRKSCYKGSNGIYAFCHIMLSYVYDGKSSDSDAFKGCSSSTKSAIKKFTAKVESWPDPPKSADIGLSETNIKAGWNVGKELQQTQKIEVTGEKGNSISVPVPDGANLIKDDKSADKGSVKVKVGESFYLTAGSDVTGTYESPKIPGAYENFQAYLIKPSGQQNQIFSVRSNNYVSYKVKWVDFGKLDITKQSSDEKITGGNDYYSLEGAEYELFYKTPDENDEDVNMGTLVTAEDGTASMDKLPYGDYYIKETKAPRGFDIDKETHEIKIATPAQSETLLDAPIPPELKTEAKVQGTGSKETLEGGTITVSDTVSYSGVEPGLEYKISGRLMNKQTGEEIDGSVSDITFTPDKPEGQVEMLYSLNSRDLGGNTAVAFEKMYYKDSLVAVHEDLNNQAQSINIKKQKDSSPRLGDETKLLLVLLMIVMSGLAGVAAIMRKV